MSLQYPDVNERDMICVLPAEVKEMGAEIPFRQCAKIDVNQYLKDATPARLEARDGVILLIP